MLNTGGVVAAAAASNQGNSGISGALDYLSALNIATKITTVIGLAALAVLCAFLLSHQWLAGRRALIDKAISTGNDELLGTALGNSNVPLDRLNKDQKFQIASTEVRQRFLTRLISQAFIFFAFLALLGFIILILRPKPVAAQTIDPLTMAGLLKFVPPDQRQQQCVKTLDATTCGRIVDAIADVHAEPQTAEVKDAVTTALDTGKVPTALANAVKKSVLTTPITQIVKGDPKGWDIDFLWCDGDNAAANQAAAQAAAQALGASPGEQIAPGVRLGRIRAAARSAVGVAADAPGEGSGRIILTDGSSGKDEAAAAIVKTLYARGVPDYTMQSSATPKSWYIQLFNCAPRPTKINPAMLQAVKKMNLAKH